MYTISATPTEELSATFCFNLKTSLRKRTRSKRLSPPSVKSVSSSFHSTQCTKTLQHIRRTLGSVYEVSSQSQNPIFDSLGTKNTNVLRCVVKKGLIKSLLVLLELLCAKTGNLDILHLKHAI